jgi:hypothetical protein
MGHQLHFQTVPHQLLISLFLDVKEKKYSLLNTNVE